MIPTTEDAEVFISTPPAWERGVELEQMMDTAVFTSRSGLEERQQRRQRGAYRLDYTAVYNAAELSARNAAAALEMAAPLVVPFWTERCQTTSGIVANVVTIDRTPDADWFVAGDWIFFDSATQGRQFRKIASVAGANLTLSGSGTAFNSGTPVYPCRRCLRDNQRAEWIPPADGNASEAMKFATL